MKRIVSLAAFAFCVIATCGPSGGAGPEDGAKQKTRIDELYSEALDGILHMPGGIVITEAAVERVDDTTLRFVPARECGSVVCLRPTHNGDAATRVMIVRELIVRMSPPAVLEVEFMDGTMLDLSGGRLLRKATFATMMERLPYSG